MTNLYCPECKKVIPADDVVTKLYAPETRMSPAEYDDPTCPECGGELTDEFFVCDNCEKPILTDGAEKKWWYDGADVCHECFRMLCKENPNLTSPMATIIGGVKKIAGGVI